VSVLKRERLKWRNEMLLDVQSNNVQNPSLHAAFAKFIMEQKLKVTDRVTLASDPCVTGRSNTKAPVYAITIKGSF
jgi:hypothetical protein